MIAEDERRVWRKSLKYGAIHASLAFVDHRLELGAGTLLGWLAHYEGAEPFLAFEGGEERALALLSIAYQRPFTRRALDNLRRGARAWIEGEACLAHIHFAHGGIRSLDQPEEDAWRLELADRVLKSPRFTPRALMKAIGCEAPWDHEFAKSNFNPDEARVPKGSGPQSGQWTSGGAGQGQAEADRARARLTALHQTQRSTNAARIRRGTQYPSNETMAAQLPTPHRQPAFYSRRREQITKRFMRLEGLFATFQYPSRNRSLARPSRKAEPMTSREKIDNDFFSCLHKRKQLCSGRIYGWGRSLGDCDPRHC